MSGFGFRGPRPQIPYGYGMMNHAEPISRNYRGRTPWGRPPMQQRFPQGNQMRWGSAFASLRGQAQPNFDDYGGDYGEYDYGGDGDMGDDGPPLHSLTPSIVKDWLQMQHPVVIREVMFHAK